MKELDDTLDLSAYIKKRNLSYEVRWNPSAKSFPDSPLGMFEVWAHGYCHYRRHTKEGILDLLK